MERKHNWQATNCWTIFRCSVCKKHTVINSIDEETTPEELLQQKQDMENRIDCSGEAYK